MAISPLDSILQGARKILDKGQEAFRDDSSALGIAKNTFAPSSLLSATNKLFFEQSTAPQQYLKKVTGLKSPAETQRELLATTRANQLPTQRLDQFGLPASTIGKQTTKVTDILKTATPKEKELLALSQARNLTAGFAGYAPQEKALTSIAPQVAKSTDIGKIANLLKKEIPSLADDTANNFARVFKDLTDPKAIDTAINKIKFQAQGKTTGMADDITKNAKAILETGKPMPVYTNKGLPALTKKTPSTPVLPSKLPPVASKVGGEVTPLLQEARKYKSAEEFVKAQSLYHGTPAKLEGNKLSFGKGDIKKGGQSGGLFLTDNPNSAKTFAFGGEVYQATPSIKNQVIDLTKKEGIDKFKAFIGKSYKDFDGELIKFDKQSFESMFPNGKADFATVSQFPELVEKIVKDNKLKGIAFNEYAGGEIGKTYQILSGDIPVYTKSQLTDIWNKANQAPKAKVELPKIRQMKTSAEIPSLERTAEMQGVTPAVKLKAPQKQTVKLPQPNQVVSPKTLKPELPRLSTGEERTLEKLAQQQASKANLVSGVEVSSLPKIIQQQTPVSKKVGLLDYIRTPENVLKKIGLEKESKLIRDSYEAYTKELPTNIQKITDWSKRVSPESNKRIFRYLDNQAVDLNPTELKVAGEIKVWLAEWADRLGLPKDNRIAEYITHIFDDQLIKKEFDEDLAKIIADKIPGSVYNPFLEKRLGAKGYIEDTWRALDAYVKRATRKVHMDKALNRLEEVSSSLEESQWKYIKRYADRINMRPTEVDNLIDNQLKQVIGYRLGQRPVANISRTLRQVTFRGMLGANLGSALRNLTQGVNTYAKLGEKYTAIGYKDVLTKGLKELKAEGILDDSIIQDRTLSATKKALEKLDKGLFFFFDTAEKINRGSAYYGAKAKALSLGKTEAQAIEYAKKIVRDTQFLYGAIDTPVAMNSDIVKVMTQFMTYPVKQTEFLAGMAKNKEYMGIARYILGGVAVVYTIGQVLGMKPTELIPFYDYVSGQSKFGVPPSLKFPAELLKAGLGTKDKFGQERSLGKKLKDVAIAGAGVIPGGIQAKKTLEGSKMVAEGGSFDKSGKLQFEQGQSPASKLQSVLLGKYAGKGAREFFDKGMKARAVIKTEKELAQEVLTKLKSGEFGSEAVAEEYLNSELKKIEKAKKEERFALPPKEYAQELLNLLKAGKLDEVTAEKELNSYLNQPEIADRTTKYVQERGKVGLVLDYGKAFTIDPGNAWKALTTAEKLGVVEGNLVEMQRFQLKKYNEAGGSDEYKKKAMAQMGLPWSEAKNYKLEHVVPVKAGGDTSANNLLIVTNAEHNSYTRFDNAAAKAVQNKKTTRRKVTEIAIKLKIDKTITINEAINML